MSVSNDDENEVFGIVSRSPPKDSIGIPHILEHSVLCGSRKYPLKEPFVEFLKDFYNLVDVYLDAFFFPKCVEDFLTFQQEGWHYELNDSPEEISYKGVVFNEMKGVYSQPDNILGRTAQQALFPDNNYGVDSGGNPKVIPKLTFEEFKEFHCKYYHPSNARILFYGDDDPNERLRILSEVNDAGKAANLYETGYQLSGSAYVIRKHISNTWLWDRVRVSGGAYGGFCDFDTHSGVFSFLSYRDPNILKTLDVYDGTAEFLHQMEMDDDTLTKAIIGTIGDVDSYQLPDAKGYSRKVDGTCSFAEKFLVFISWQNFLVCCGIYWELQMKKGKVDVKKYCQPGNSLY